jgi:hypothetical protein
MFKKLGQYYSQLALMLLNSLLFFVFVNIFILVGFKVFDRPDAPKRRDIQDVSDILDRGYSHLSIEQRDDLLRETRALNLEYEAFTQFKEIPFEGIYVNVSNDGFRMSKDQGPWPPDPDNFNVFVFGGSTTFGYCVADDETIASYLQGFLNATQEKKCSIYNFGRGFYYSAQERVLFEKLLLAGFVPNMVVFIDGLNDFFNYTGEPYYTNSISGFVRDANTKSMVGTFLRLTVPLQKLPIWRLASSFREEPSDQQDYEDKKVLMGVIERYIKNKSLIENLSRMYSVQSVFVWQPIPSYKFDLTYHLTEEFGPHTYSQFGYRIMQDYVTKNRQGLNFLWCADMQEDIKEPLYVDPVHYSADMSKRIALMIFNMLEERDLI